MEKKFNLVQLLNDCPKGMELDCTLFNNVTLNYVSNDGIYINYFDHNGHENEIYLDCEGCLPLYNLKSVTDKCVIFPKGKTTWEGFQRPFKYGDVLITDSGSLCIYKSIHKTYKSNDLIDFYCGYRPNDNQLVLKDKKDTHFGLISEAKLATEEEKKKLFDAIKSNGYKWNFKTKNLERLVKPNFKVGDRIKNKYGFTTSIVKIIDEYYKYDNGDGRCGFISIKKQDEWELVSNKFDIITLKPYDKVLGRMNDDGIWVYDLFSFYNNSELYNKFHCVGVNCRYCIGVNYRYCIPYEGNEHLLGTTNDCDEYFKTWE